MSTPRSSSLNLLKLLALFALLAALVVGQGPVSAQDGGGADTNEPTDATWMPLVGTYQMNCTVMNPPHPGPCDNHHSSWAVDIIGDQGTPIYAAGAGELHHVFGGCSPFSGELSCNNGGGNYIAIDHGGYLSRYIHLASFERDDVGGWVEAGELIGYMGASGTSAGTGPHLHYDETTPFPEQRLPFGPMLACHGDAPVQYPDALGYDSWLDVPYGTMLRNDGFECLGGVTVRPPTIDPQPGGSVGVAIGDFAGTGYGSVAMGAPGEDLGNLENAGAVSVAYATAAGLAASRDDTTTLFQRRNLPGLAEADDLVGASLAIGDFDCDGFDDLAIGTPGEDLGAVADAGGVNVVHGSANGLGDRPAGFYQGRGKVPGQAAEGNLFGGALAAGDFNGDGCTDLAIGAPGQDIGTVIDAGAVVVLYGSELGLHSEFAAEPLLHEGAGLTGTANTSDLAGATLAAGDLDCDGIDDLVVGIPADDIGGARDAGSIRIVLGSAGAGLGSQLAPMYQSVGIAGILEGGDYLGAALATGDVNDDGCDDLAIGVPGEGIFAVDEVGLVSVLFGSASTLGSIDSTSVHWQGNGLYGTGEAGDRAGEAVAVTDINCDGFDDVIVGVPGEALGRLDEAGMLNVLYGSNASGPAALVTANDGWHQANLLSGRAEAGDLVGTSLAAGDINNDGCGDVVVGAPGEAIGALTSAGAVHVLHGSADGPVNMGVLWQASLGGAAEAGDSFGGPSVFALLGITPGS